MLFDGSKVLVNKDGTEVMENDKPITVSFVLINALDTAPEGKRFSGTDKLARFKIQSKLHEAVMPVELDLHEVKLIQQALEDATFISPFVYGQIFRELKEQS
jgi:hypothetical protein